MISVRDGNKWDKPGKGEKEERKKKKYTEWQIYKGYIKELYFVRKEIKDDTGSQGSGLACQGYIYIE